VDVVVTFQLEQFQQVQLPLGAALSPVDAARIQAITGLDLSTVISPASKVMLEQVDVLAIDPVTEASSGSTGASDQNQGQQVPKVPLITLMVTPADAEKLVFAEEFGSIWFTLVPVGDTSPVSTPGQALPGLLR
jgi:Flp pilus assembly protein CpaB